MCQPGPARAAAVVPRRLARLGRLPQHEVARVLLVVVVGVDARAGLHAFVIEPRELAVVRQRRDPEVDRSVGRVRVAARLERAGSSRPSRAGSPRRSRAGSPRPARGPAPPRPRETPRCTDRCTRAASTPAFARRVDRLVVDVGEVHDLADRVALLVLQRAAQHVEADERPEVADVPARVDRQAARVHADGLAVGGRESSSRSRQRVVEAHRVRCRSAIGADQRRLHVSTRPTCDRRTATSTSTPPARRAGTPSRSGLGRGGRRWPSAPHGRGDAPSRTAPGRRPADAAARARRTCAATSGASARIRARSSGHAEASKRHTDMQRADGILSARHSAICANSARAVAQSAAICARSGVEAVELRARRAATGRTPGAARAPYRSLRAVEQVRLDRDAVRRRSSAGRRRSSPPDAGSRRRSRWSRRCRSAGSSSLRGLQIGGRKSERRGRGRRRARPCRR